VAELLIRLSPDDLSAPDFERRVVHAATLLLQRFGRVVTDSAHTWEPTGALCQRLAISHDTFSRRLPRLQAWKIPLEIQRGPRGSIRAVLSNPTADRLLRTSRK